MALIVTNPANEVPSRSVNGSTMNYADPALREVFNKVGGALTDRARLTDFDLSVLQQAVAAQNLEKYGLKVGDQKTINGRDYVIAGLNPMKGTATPYRLTEDHVGLIVSPIPLRRGTPVEILIRVRIVEVRDI